MGGNLDEIYKSINNVIQEIKEEVRKNYKLSPL